MKRNILGQILLPFLATAVLTLGQTPEARGQDGAQPPAAALPNAEQSVPPMPDSPPPEPAAPAHGGMAEGMTSSRVETRPPEKILTPEARETYAYLLFIQSLLDEDEAGLLDIVPELAASEAPLNVWLDGGVWLMSRKSPNAVIFLEQALKFYPDDLSLNLLYSEALGDHGMAAQGVDIMRGFLKKHPDSMDARMELALLLVKDKQFDEAQKLLAQITPKQRTPLVDYYQAKALIGMDKRAQAIPYLRKAVKGMPDFVEAIAELAFIYEEEGNYREARAAYEKLQKLNFSPQDVALRLVNLSLKLRQPDRASQYVRRGPDSMPFRITAANMFLESRYYLQAESILKQLAGRPDTPFEVYLLLADLVFDQRRNLAMAFAWLDKIKPASPGYEKAQLLRIQLQAEAGKTEDALRTADAALKDFPDMQELWDMKIRLLARDKKTAQALELAAEARKRWPDSTGMSFLYGSLLDESGRKKEAFGIMEDILKKQPDNYQALNYVGFTLAEENRELERALKLLRKADELSPNQAYIVDSLAWAMFKSGQGAEALRLIRRAITLGETPDPAIWEHYGDIARSLGRRDEARRAYRKAIELKPSNMEELRKRLSAI